MPDDQPQPPPPPRPQPPIEVDLDLVGLEASGLGEDQQSRKERKQLFGEPKRQEQFRQVLHVCRLTVLAVGLIVILSIFIVRGLHLILPENNTANAGKWIPHGWLTTVQLDSLDKFIFGAIIAFVAEYGGRALLTEFRRGSH